MATLWLSFLLQGLPGHPVSVHSRGQPSPMILIPVLTSAGMLQPVAPPPVVNSLGPGGRWGERSIDNYQILAQCGEGTYGQVCIWDIYPFLGHLPLSLCGVAMVMQGPFFRGEGTWALFPFRDEGRLFPLYASTWMARRMVFNKPHFLMESCSVACMLSCAEIWDCYDVY